MTYQFLNLLRNLWIRIHDPLVAVQVHGKPLLMPLSHDLALNVASHPYYNSVFLRLATYLAGRDGRLEMIDVGANIGDTAALCAVTSKDRFLCIEADETFGDLIVQNIPNGKTHATRVHCLCGESDGTSSITEERSLGTAVFRLHDNNSSINKANIRSLDSLLLEYVDFAGANLVKIDCDGHDFRIIQGAGTLLRRQPSLIFEAAPCANSKYLTEALATFARLAEAGYEAVFFYDNFGYPFGQFATCDTQAIEQALEYQCVSRRLYFDVLAMTRQELEKFIAQERLFFAAVDGVQGST